jgi:ribosomal protein S18 acetylase RimI-like enzyme
MIIRKYIPSDRKSVEFIQLETYFLGKPIQKLLDHPERLNKELSYYFEQEPESCFVAVDNGKVVGYLLGCLDDKNHEESLSKFLFKSLLRLFELPFMSKKDRRYYWGPIQMVFMVVLGKAEEAKFKTPKDSGHLHINLLPKARGKGVGSKLLRAFFKYAKSKGVRRIHADSFRTRLNPNSGFWLKNGFKEYCKVRTIAWKQYYAMEKINLICYVKEL